MAAPRQSNSEIYWRGGNVPVSRNNVESIERRDGWRSIYVCTCACTCVDRVSSWKKKRARFKDAVGINEETRGAELLSARRSRGYTLDRQGCAIADGVCVCDHRRPPRVGIQVRAVRACARPFFKSPSRTRSRRPCRMSRFSTAALIHAAAYG